MRPFLLISGRLCEIQIDNVTTMDYTHDMYDTCMIHMYLIIRRYTDILLQCFSILCVSAYSRCKRLYRFGSLAAHLVGHYRSAGLNLLWWLLAHWSKWHSHDDPTMCLSSTSSKAFPVKIQTFSCYWTQRPNGHVYCHCLFLNAWRDFGLQVEIGRYLVSSETLPKCFYLEEVVMGSVSWLGKWLRAAWLGDWIR